MWLLVVALSLPLAGCAGLFSKDTSVGRFKVGKPYTVAGETYVPQERYAHEETGIASWYGPGFDGKKTANGETFDQNELTAAHPTLQMPSLIRVTNLENGKSVVVRVNDRGPFHGNRAIDLSKRAAELLEFRNRGTAKVKIQLLGDESMAIAQAARRGIDTKGAEVAINKTGQLEPRFAAFQPAGHLAPEPQTVYGNEIVAASSVGANTAPILSDATPLPFEPAPMNTQDAIAPAVMSRKEGTGEYPSIPVATLQPDDIKPRFEGHYREGHFYPDPVVTQLPVRASDIYVRAGAMMSLANAQKLSRDIAGLGPNQIVPVGHDGLPYYRVHIGPIETVDKADQLVNTLLRQGRQAGIVVTEN